MNNLDIRHCFSCGGRAIIRFVEGRDRHTCEGCNNILYANPSPVGAVLLIQQGRILLVKRAVEPQIGYWGLPAGYQELDETPEAAARREMYEETGLVAGKLQLFDLVYNDHNPLKPANVAVFLTEEASGTPRPGDDVSELGFFPLKQLPTHLAFGYIKTCLNRLPLSLSSTF